MLYCMTSLALLSHNMSIVSKTLAKPWPEYWPKCYRRERKFDTVWTMKLVRKLLLA